MADEKNNSPENNKSAPAPTPVAETTAQTHHSITLNGQKIDYTVTTGTIILKEEDVEEGEKTKSQHLLRRLYERKPGTQPAPSPFRSMAGRDLLPFGCIWAWLDPSGS